MNKPLTPEERENVMSRLFISMPNERMEDFNAMLRDGVFWREAVKNCDPYVTHREHGGDWKECRFCGGGWGPQHTPTCAWKLAQED